MVLMALAHLSVERPGWDDALNRIALKVDDQREGRAVMYDGFRALQRSRVAQVPSSAGAGGYTQTMSQASAGAGTVLR